MTTGLELELRSSMSGFLDELEKFNPATYNQKPASDAWSAAEVAAHIYIIERNGHKIMEAPAVETEREPDKKVALLQAALEDMNTKRVAPDTVRPEGKANANLHEAILNLRSQREELIQKIREIDMHLLCEVYPHPSLGRLTRLEWIHFIIHHTRRHTKQLAAIHQVVQEA